MQDAGDGLVRWGEGGGRRIRGRGPVGEDWEREKERSRMRERERPQKRKAAKHIAAEQSSRDGRQAWPGTADGSPQPCRTPAAVPGSVRRWWRGTAVATDAVRQAGLGAVER